MYRPKTAKSQAQTTKLCTLITTFNPKPIYSIQPFIMFVSIDPAPKNCGFRIEKRWTGLNEAVSHVETLAYCVFDFIPGDADQKDLYVNIKQQLDIYDSLYQNINFVLIEKQLPQNYISCSVMHILISYFVKLTEQVNPNLMICLVDTKLKGKMLNAPKNLTHAGMKKWVVPVSKEIHETIGDVYALDILDKTKKKDDIADTTAMIEAVCRYFGLPKILLNSLSELDNYI